jgi:hypothetical protein
MSSMWPVEPILADPHVANVSPLSDPFHAGLLPSQTAALLAPGRSHHGPGQLPDAGPVEGPDVDVRGQLGEVLGESGSEDSGVQESVPRQLIASDADPVRHGIFTGSDGAMYHIRPATIPGTGGSTIRYGGSQFGTSGDGSPSGAA